MHERDNENDRASRLYDSETMKGGVSVNNTTNGISRLNIHDSHILKGGATEGIDPR